MGASLDSLHVPSGFGGRAGSDMSTSHIFPQGVLAASTLVGYGLEMEGLKPELGVTQTSPSSVAITALLGEGSDLRLLEQRP